MLAGRVVAVSSLEEFPAEAAVDRESCRVLGVKSNLCLPVLGGRAPRRRPGFQHPAGGARLAGRPGEAAAGSSRRSSPTRWRERAADDALRESEERLGLAADAAGGGAVGPRTTGTGVFWATERGPGDLRVRAGRGDQPGSASRRWVHSRRLGVGPRWERAGGSAAAGEPLDVVYRIVRARRRRRAVDRTRAGDLPSRARRRARARDRASRIDVTERKRAERESRERLEFETLIADLSSKFVNLPAGEVDREIMDAERRICEVLGLDLAALWQWSDEAPGLLHAHPLLRRPGPSAAPRADESP